MLPTFILFLLKFLLLVHAEIDTELVGTWVSKSRDVVTGPEFCDPIKDRFIEPRNTGISYSFTDDEYYEEAHFRVVSNPTKPSCPKGILQFQHGEYMIESNGSLILTPFAVDGRQLTSDPCKADKAEYYRYNQTKVFDRYEVVIDRFHNVQRLINLYQHDGSPMIPMFLAYKPPQMLPTETLNPIARPTDKAKRGETGYTHMLKSAHQYVEYKEGESLFRVLLWWLGVALVAIGAGTLLFPS